MTIKALDDPKRAAIIESLASDELKFNELSKKLNTRSNELSYHLKLLLDIGYVEKNSSGEYRLTDKGKVLVPYLKIFQREEMPPTIFCAPVVINKNKILFIKRPKEPYKGFLEFPGGKIRKGETLIQAAVRELKEETNVIAENGRIICLADILTSKNHHFVGVYVQMDFVKDLGKDGAENQERIWIDKSKITSTERLLDDNKLVVSRFLNKAISHITLFYDEEKNEARLL
jgi:ADP-ribose pyrophosphatase YjhB (NUDIX family)/predicted transcriptional regulator